MCPLGETEFRSELFDKKKKKKLLRPEFVPILTREMEDEIFDSIGRLITTLQEVAIDERHTPHLYARFLASLLTKHRRGGSTLAGRLQPRPLASQLAPPGQRHGYGGSGGVSEGGHASQAGMQAPPGSEPRQDSDAMQMNLGVLSNRAEGLASTVPQSQPQPQSQPDMASSHGLDGAVLGSGSGKSGERGDIRMADLFADAGTLATMHALNEVWWGNMMMPGCVFIFSFVCGLTESSRMPIGSLGRTHR